MFNNKYHLLAFLCFIEAVCNEDVSSSAGVSHTGFQHFLPRLKWNVRVLVSAWGRGNSWRAGQRLPGAPAPKTQRSTQNSRWEVPAATEAYKKGTKPPARLELCLLFTPSENMTLNNISDLHLRLTSPGNGSAVPADLSPSSAPVRCWDSPACPGSSNKTNSGFPNCAHTLTAAPSNC